jgi:tetratricopeptide (TPR) repeat protein
MKRIFYLLSMIFLCSCGNSSNSEEFMRASEGRYLYGPNEVVVVDYIDGTMQITFEDQKMIPLKVNDSSFFVKEMNVKYVFVSEPEMHIEYTPVSDVEKTFQMRKLTENEKTPGEYFTSGNYDKAKEAYLAIQKKDSLDESIIEWKLNRRAYDYLRDDEMEKAKEMFEINIALYPKSSNTYDSMGDYYREAKDTLKAIEFYEKALSINPENRSSKRQLKRLKKE